MVLIFLYLRSGFTISVLHYDILLFIRSLSSFQPILAHVLFFGGALNYLDAVMERLRVPSRPAGPDPGRDRFFSKGFSLCLFLSACLCLSLSCNC